MKFSNSTITNLASSLTFKSKKIKKIIASTATALALMYSTGEEVRAQNSNQDIYIQKKLKSNIKKKTQLRSNFNLSARKIESMEYRMMGGVDISLDYRFNPANIALLDKPVSFRLFGIEANASDASEIYNATKDIWDLSKILNSDSKQKTKSNKEDYLEILSTLKKYPHSDLGGRAKIDLLQFNIGTGDLGIAMFGLYAEGESSIKTNFTQLGKFTNILESIVNGTLNTQTLFDQYKNLDLNQQIIANQNLISDISANVLATPTISSSTNTQTNSQTTNTPNSQTLPSLNSQTIQIANTNLRNIAIPNSPNLNLGNLQIQNNLNELNINQINLDQINQNTINTIVDTSNQIQLSNLNPSDLRTLATNLIKDSAKIDLGKELDLVKLFARTDIGGYVGIGKRFKLFEINLESQNVKIKGKGVNSEDRSDKLWTAYMSAGIKTRGFYRLAIPQFQIKIPRYIPISQINSIFKIPRLRTVKGIGYGIDTYFSLALNDPILNTKISLELRDVLNKTKYETKQTTREDMQINLGLSIEPLSYINHSNLLIGLDVENLERKKPTIQIGLAWKLGTAQYNITPKIGFIFDEENQFNETHNIFTAGSEINFKSAKINVIYERNMDTRREMFGFGLQTEF